MEKLFGKDGFITYYSKLFPNNSIDQITEALSIKNNPILLFLPEHESQLKTLWDQNNLLWQTLPWFKQALIWPENIPFGIKLPGYDEHLFYPMNASSLLPVVALSSKENELILDACAAPGGKSLAIANSASDSIQLFANDVSPHRLHLMKNIFKTFNQDWIQTIHQPAEMIFQKFPNTFDKILLDAPCSSEKHVWQNKQELNKWSTNRIKQLHLRQYALISGLLLALKPGGILVYSTCAINPRENELLIEKVLQKKSDLVQLVPFEVSNIPGEAGMKTDPQVSYNLNYVRRVPLINDVGSDPMFVAILKRL